MMGRRAARLGFKRKSGRHRRAAEQPRRDPRGSRGDPEGSWPAQKSFETQLAARTIQKGRGAALGLREAAGTIQKGR